MMAHFFFSKKHKYMKFYSIYNTLSNKYIEYQNYCKLNSGEVVEYTEMCDELPPLSEWDDLIYLGEGEYDHSTRI